MVKKSLLNKCRKIKLLLSDVDGVLTDGGMYYSRTGESLKKFNTRDGMAVELLQNMGIPVVFITKEQSVISRKRAKKVKAAAIYSGVTKKEDMLPKILKKFNVRKDHVAYIGDDINDLAIMKKVGFCAAPGDCEELIANIADYVCTKNGGEGVFREVTNLIISSKSNYNN